jgi:hypothetical protein
MSDRGELTHLDKQGLSRTVDVSTKAETRREAEAEAVLWVGPEVVRASLASSNPQQPVPVLLQKADSKEEERDQYLGPVERLVTEHLLKWVSTFTKDMETLRRPLCIRHWPEIQCR